VTERRPGRLRTAIVAVIALGFSGAATTAVVASELTSSPPAVQTQTAADDSRARQLLHDVYQRPEFRDLDQNGDNVIASSLRRFAGWLVDNTVNRLGRTLSLLLGSVVLLLVLLLAMRRLAASSAGREVHAIDGDGAGGDDPDAEWSLAEAAAARGDHREAVRRAFRSALLSVALRGRMTVNPAWTTRELLARAAGDADLVAALAPAAALFDRAWYSKHEAGEAEWVTMRERCHTIRRLAGRGVEAAA
jgi:hypothetical protein